jgi:hypothetical protein
MSRLKIVLLGAMACLLTVAVTAASAQAHEWKVAGKAVTGTEHFKFKVKDYTTEAKLLGTPFGVATHVECKLVEVTEGGLLKEGLGFASFAFRNCTVAKPANCTVKEPIVTRADFDITGATTELFKQLGVEPFATVQLEGAACSIKEAFAVTGEQECGAPGLGTEAAGHEIVCVTTGSKLKAGGKVATFESTVKGIEIEGGKLYSGV